MNKLDGRLKRSIATRKRILTCAKDIFLEHGYENTTIKMINEGANTGYGTVYVHFPEGKDQILYSIMDEVMEEFYSVADIDFQPKTRHDAYMIIKDQVLHFLKLGNQYQSLLKVFYEAMGFSTLLKNKWEEILLKFVHRITSDITYSQNLELARRIPTEVVAKMLLYTGERFLWEIAFEKTELSVDTIAETIVEIYMFGLYKAD
ncbi:TetR/AcrR family transcriptional regulator [Bacillus massilinigeriensis]|uniref:TetR/AcrR family transcriptional regulator n=1 Tax=Bacillus massilionigeriensis TaxID=1805475 RepID=UPI00096B23FC|nr:TetR/AcrR family transcriptional regulator [Bacillus massilionigeriensis]